MRNKRQRNNGRLRRKRRIRNKIEGSSERPRLTIYRSNRHMYAQIINDETGVTVASASTKDPELVSVVDGKEKREQALEVGKLVATRAREAGIESVVFDRNGYIYHGRVAAVAEGARDAGLDF